MITKSRESIYGASVRAAAEQAAEARKAADRLACEAWNKRMLGFQGPAQPSLALANALNAGYLYLEVKCLGCNTHQTVALTLSGVQGDTDPRTGALYALQGLFGASRAAVQAQPSSRVAAGEDFRRRACVNLVAGRTISRSERDL
jgi:hypothetical protein